jgi:hypothetical protein
MAKLDCAMTLQENEELQQGYRKLERKMCEMKLLIADLQVHKILCDIPKTFGNN